MGMGQWGVWARWAAQDRQRAREYRPSKVYGVAPAPLRTPIEEIEAWLMEPEVVPPEATVSMSMPVLTSLDRVERPGMLDDCREVDNSWKSHRTTKWRRAA